MIENAPFTRLSEGGCPLADGQPVVGATGSFGDRSPAPWRAADTDDSISVLRFAFSAWKAGLPTALATLVSVEGGAARAVGSQMAIRSDGGYCGFVSGGCVEAVVAAEALAALELGEDRTLLLGAGSPFFDVRLPCGGAITIAIHVLCDVGPLGAVLEDLAERRRTGLFYCPDTQTLAATEAPRISGWSSGQFVVSYCPRLRILVSGSSIEARMVVKFAGQAGYEPVALGTSATNSLLSIDIDEDTAVVILHHDIEAEIPVLQAALDGAPFYIGALGSRRTHDQRVSRLTAMGYSEDQIARIKAPIGIFGRARDAASLALSVLADVAERRSRFFEEASAQKPSSHFISTSLHQAIEDRQ